jgi:hypothetical protein
MVDVHAPNDKTSKASVGVDHEAACIEFEHEVLAARGGGGPVAVRQDLSGENVAEGRDATARWVWDAAAPMATWMCEHASRIAGKTVVELGAGPGMPVGCQIVYVDHTG